MHGIKIPPSDVALKMQGGLCARGGGVFVGHYHINKNKINGTFANTEAAVRCLGHHFLLLYACGHEVSFPDQRPQSLVWKRD